MHTKYCGCLFTCGQVEARRQLVLDFVYPSRTCIWRSVKKRKSWKMSGHRHSRQKNVKHLVTDVPWLRLKFALVFGVPHALNGCWRAATSIPALIYMGEYLCSCVSAALCVCWTHSSASCMFFSWALSPFTPAFKIVLTKHLSKDNGSKCVTDQNLAFI